MINTRVRAVAAGAAAALLLSPLAACGSDDDGADTKKSSASASADPSADASAEASEGSDAEGASSDDEGGAVDKDEFIKALQDGIEDGKSAHMTMKMGTMLDAEGDVVYDDNGSSMKMTMDMGGQKATMIFVDGVLYMQMPGMSQPGKFTKVDKDTPQLGAMIQQMENMGPAGSTEVMQKGLKDVKLVGDDEIDGEKVKHYKVTVDTSAAAGQMGVDPSAAPEAMQDVAYDLYLDEDNRMRKVQMEIQGQQMVMEVTDWGKDVDIKAPPASDVVEVPGMAGSQQ